MAPKKRKRQLKVGKSTVIFIVLALVLIGIWIVLFSNRPVERMTAYTMLIDSIMPVLIVMSSGVGLSGIANKILEGRALKFESSKENDNKYQ